MKNAAVENPARSPLPVRFSIAPRPSTERNNVPARSESLIIRSAILFVHIMNNHCSAAVAFASAVALAACTPMHRVGLAVAPHALYVAMGSSFAAGPGIATTADRTPKRCARSTGNYAHLLASSLDLNLVDASCSGATTDHILGAWNELAPQIDAVRPQTALVTITVGGNDVDYIGALMAASCRDGSSGPQRDQVMDACRKLASMAPSSDARQRFEASKVPESAKWARLESNLHRINAEIKARSPKARIIYVTYVTALPASDLCPEVPLSAKSAETARATAARLLETTESVARQDHVEVFDATSFSQGHDACAADAWSNGFLPRTDVPPSAPYHPNAKAMQAIADALATILGKVPPHTDGGN